MKKQSFILSILANMPIANSQQLTVLLFLFPFALIAQPKIQLQDHASGFISPVDIAHCGDSRLFIVEQRGYIWMLDSLGNRLPDTFLNIDGRVRSGGERGLLGLAFPPDYAQTGYFFVNYTRETDGGTRISRFSRDSVNPNKADPNSELILLTQDQPFANHNGGCLKFGPDGYLYAGLGDGGSGGDPQGNGQKKTIFLGKILRIDVSNSNASALYAIPADNPFVGNSEYLPEIWSLGWRNPWRFSFDRLTGDMWVGDVGQSTREEVDFEPANTGGHNYGWRCYEGSETFSTGGCLPAGNYTFPVFDYDNNSLGCSVTGGFVYRGSKYPDLYGRYIFTDYCSGRWWVIKRNADGTFSPTLIADLANSQYSSLGEDKNGELYVTQYAAGKIQKIKELCSPFQVSLENMSSPVCANSLSGFIFLNGTGGANPVTYTWSNGQTGPESSIVYLNPGIYTVTATDGNGCVRRDTFEIERFGPDVPTLAVSDTVLCSGESIALTASNLALPNQLNWYRDDQIFTTTMSTENVYSLSVTEPGKYRVQLVDSVCTNVISREIIVTEEPVIEPVVSVSGDSLFGGSPCNGCQWMFNNEPIPGATGPYYVATQSGIYELEIISPNGCKYQSSGIQITVGIADLPALVRQFSLTPNPAHNEILLKMELEKNSRITISLSDTQQRQIFMQTHQSQKITLPIDLRSLPAGTYFLNVQMDNGTFVRKVVKR
ncbi:MAG TPA: PQQ-dependent sugar dehydrogenase [Saprospiraceae bacterium]|nr:PQQ-dependent sugar dehydrogenase [Saprospiraceae bacterium]